jgi:nucleoside-diphosphate-sugar epimerase
MESTLQASHVAASDDAMLVTGSTGFIGARVVETLLEYGFNNIRCFIRPTSRLERLQETLRRYSGGKDVKLVAGDLLSVEDCREATENVSIIYHLAAGIDKSFAGAFMNSVLSTRNLMDAFLKWGRPQRFVNVSSFAVYSNLNMKRGALLDETCPLEDAPQQRFDAYGYGKLKQDQLVVEYGRQRNLPYVIVRPGAVFGPGKPKLTGRVGIDTFGFLVHLGGSNPLPLTYVDNCAEAIVLAGLKPGLEGEVFNVVDDDVPTSKEFLRGYKKQTGVFSLSMPYPLTELFCAGWEKYARATHNQLPPVFNRRRCSAEWKGNHYSNRKLKERLGWKPRVDMKSAMASFLSQFSNS